MHHDYSNSYTTVPRHNKEGLGLFLDTHSLCIFNVPFFIVRLFALERIRSSHIILSIPDGCKRTMYEAGRSLRELLRC